ncbi:MAG TPA: FAD-binding oxidoreductase [Candidatus Dormibacteraeota bacterium]|nr:FAD-binding oxidoreductase [Candidatus Dormibacteraeota bacterium]
MSTAATWVLPRLEKLLGSSRVRSDATTLADYEVDGKKPAAVLYPGSVEEVAAAIGFAAAEKLAVIPTGGRSKLRIGAPPSRYDLAIDLTQLNRVVAYDAGDLTVGVQPGVRFGELSRVLGEQKQIVPLSTAFSNVATIGGIVATNAVSPLRYAYGSARDFVLGIEIVTGDGVIAKSGGSVVKNVTGYDLHKLLIGSHGTLGVITRINFKTFPWPAAQQTFIATFADIEGALAYSRAIRQSPLEPRLVELLDGQASRLADLTAALDSRVVDSQRQHLPKEGWAAVVSVAGKSSVVERHAKDLAMFAEQAHAATFSVVDETVSGELLSNVREFVSRALKTYSGATVVRVNALPSAIRLLVTRLKDVSRRNAIVSACVIRAGGVIYYVLLPEDNAASRLAQAAKELMEAALGEKGSERPMIEWCPAGLKEKVNVWGPASEDLLLMIRVKKIFDPHGIMSPGRFAAGI